MILSAAETPTSRSAFLRYLLASAIALGCDVALFLAALRLGMAPAASAALGYLSGIAVHWSISSRLVFRNEVAADRTLRRTQQALFAASALLGLAISVAVVAAAAGIGLDLGLAKLCAALIAFHAVWLVRRHLVFAR